MGMYQTSSAYFYVGGFKGTGVQDAYIVYPIGNITGPFPLVAFAHGAFKHTPNDTASDYKAILTHMASHGMVVAAFNTCLFECDDPIYASDQLHLITMLRENPHLHPVLAHVNFNQIALAGHSMGGGATITNAGSDMLGLVTAVAIHPATGGIWGGNGSNVKIPTFYMCGSRDLVVPCPTVKAQYENTPPIGVLQTLNVFAELQGAEHTEIQTPLPGSRWDYYIVQFLLCQFKSSNTKACAVIYGTSPSSMCEAGLMVRSECLHNMTASPKFVDERASARHQLVE
jgi:predicted dienelactone hydrolase